MSDGLRLYANNEVPEGMSETVLNALFLLLDAAPAVTTDDGVWVQYYPFSRASVEVSGDASALSVQLCGSNAETVPANSDDGSSLGSAITENGMTTLSTACRWLKAKLTGTSLATGTVTVLVNAVSP